MILRDFTFVLISKLNVKDNIMYHGYFIYWIFYYTKNPLFKRDT